MTARLVAEHFAAHLWVYLVCTACVLLNLTLSKGLDEDGNEKLLCLSAIHRWYIIGSPLVTLFYCTAATIPIRPFVPHLTEQDVPCRRTFACYQVIIYLLFCTITFFAPFGEFRKMKLLESGIASTRAPGWASVNCTADKTPGSIDVRTDLYSYFQLADPQWRVASENFTQVSWEDGRSWVVAPILYDGPANGCRSKYPLFAVCIDKTQNIPSQCGWGDAQRGASTHMRLMTASPDIEEDGHTRKVFWEEWVPHPYSSSQKVKLHHENLFQFNTPSYDETVAYLERKGEQHRSLKRVATVVWFSVSAPVALLALVLVVRDHAVGAGANTSVPRSRAPDSCSSSEVDTPCLDVLSPTAFCVDVDGSEPCDSDDELLTFSVKGDESPRCLASL
eukprot:Rhum_TRINITY_DN8112_c0_g1::Rhum_TRINITY_DN8112_c0_g1_i1::g.26264::m.26264